MMQQLGITRLRPGPSGNESDPHHANYDEALANPFPVLPDPLQLKSGEPVTTAEVWWEKRRAEIVEDFEREVYGCVPDGVPQVTWTVKETRESTLADIPLIEQWLEGTVDNAMCPSIEVKIRMTLGLPKNAPGPVPVLMMFGMAGFRGGRSAHPQRPADNPRSCAGGSIPGMGPSRTQGRWSKPAGATPRSIRRAYKRTTVPD